MKGNQCLCFLAGVAGILASIESAWATERLTGQFENPNTLRETLFRSKSESPEIEFGLIAEPKPAFPKKLAMNGVRSGYARILVSVSELGRLEDWLMLETLNQDFAEEIDKVI